jgi:hypothetical protein
MGKTLQYHHTFRGLVDHEINALGTLDYFYDGLERLVAIQCQAQSLAMQLRYDKDSLWL